MENSLVIRCSCEHDGQDQLHGKYNRVHNLTVKGKSSGMFTWRCTVCGTINTKGRKD